MAERAAEHGAIPKAPPAPKRTPIPEASQPMAELIQAVLGPRVIDVTHAFGEVTVYVQPEDVVEACRLCRDDIRLQMDYLRCLSGVDYVESFEVVYHLSSIPLGHKVVLKTTLPHEKPNIATVTGVWTGADWHEREMMEMFDILVAGHPDPRPLLLEEDTDEHPLLKTHPLVAIGADRPGIIPGPGDLTGFVAGAWVVPPVQKQAIADDAGEEAT